MFRMGLEGEKRQKEVGQIDSERWEGIEREEIG